MIIKESFEVPVAREHAVAFLLDIERMSACIPGVDGLRALDDGEYEATLRLQLGPIRSQFSGRARLDDSAAPDRLSATAEGRDRASGSQVQVTFHADVTEHPGPRTVVDCEADVTIRGKLGQFGTGLITSTARSVLREFAACASEVLTHGPDAVAPAAPSTARIARRSMGLYLQSKLRRGADGPDGPATAPANSPTDAPTPPAAPGDGPSPDPQP